MKESILLLDTECGTHHSAGLNLMHAGYAVRQSTSRTVLEDAVRSRPSLLLIVASLPHWRCLDVCRAIRREPKLSSMRIVLLTDSESEKQPTPESEAGADLCISNVTSPADLVHSIESVLHGHHHGFGSSDETTEIVIDRAAMKISIEGTEVKTTNLEFRLVDYLAQHKGNVCTRDVLLDAVWGETEFVMPRSVDSCIRRLRDKIEPNRSSPRYLKTVRGVGYRLDGKALWPTSITQCNCGVCSASFEVSGFRQHDVPKTKKTERPVGHQTGLPSQHIQK